MFDVMDRDSSDIVTVYAHRTNTRTQCGIEFLIFMNNDWVWVNASYFRPVPKKYPL